MAAFRAFSPGIEVNGETILAVVDGIVSKERARKILAANGLSDVTPGKWYKQQNWLDAFLAISNILGPNTLFSIGQAIPSNAKWPPGIDTLEKALGSIDMAYHANHRGGEIGHYRLQPKIHERALTMTCQNPYPCDFDRGLIDAVARKFKPSGALVLNVAHDDNKPCRKKGAESCTYQIAW